MEWLHHQQGCSRQRESAKHIQYHSRSSSLHLRPHSSFAHQYTSTQFSEDSRSGDTPHHDLNHPAGRPQTTWMSQIVRDTGSLDSQLPMHGLLQITGQCGGRYNPPPVTHSSEWVSESASQNLQRHYLCVYSRHYGVDAFELGTTEHHKHWDPLVDKQSPSSAAATATATGWAWSDHTSHRHSRLQNIPWQQGRLSSWTSGRTQTHQSTDRLFCIKSGTNMWQCRWIGWIWFCVTDLWENLQPNKDLRYLVLQLSSRSLLLQELLLSGIHYQTPSPRWLHSSEASCLLHHARRPAHSIAVISVRTSAIIIQIQIHISNRSLNCSRT